MKKLLAIAVSAAFAAPMMASADVTVGGNLNQEYAFGSTGAKQIVDDGGDNEITVKASTPLNNGMTGTAAITHEFNASGDTADVANTHGKLGIKGGFGHVTIGAVSKPMDAVDGVVGFLPSDFSFDDGTGNQGINYTGTFGGLTAMALVRPSSASALARSKSQLGLAYKAGPFAAAVGVDSQTAGTDADDAKSRFAVAYNGSNYSVGALMDKAHGGAKATSVGGKYSFGSAYVSASVGKKAGAKGNALKLGYHLGKSTEVYVASTKGTSAAPGNEGLANLGTQNASRTNVIGINQKF